MRSTIPRRLRFADQLEGACRTAIGDSLRSITYFTPEEFKQVYLRDDLARDADLTGFVENESRGFHTRADYRGSELGEYEYTIRSFENGYVTRVIAGDHGVFVTTDTLTMHHFEEMASAVSQVLRSEERQAPHR